MEFRIPDTFTDSLARLTGDEQKATSRKCTTPSVICSTWRVPARAITCW
jgi:hypothetical protein